MKVRGWAERISKRRMREERMLSPTSGLKGMLIGYPNYFHSGMKYELYSRD